jgi:cytochrome c oxidase subunit 2
MEKAGYIIVGIISALIVGSLLILVQGGYYWMPMYRMGYEDGRYYPPGCCQGPVNFQSNGERIYYTGINENGERIPFTGGPTWLMNHGGSCVNCHGRDGKGGFVPMMCNKQAPDIRYSEMTEEGMSEEEIKTAITKGVHEGEELNWCMPRWQMSEEDLNDIIAYLKEL